MLNNIMNALIDSLDTLFGYIIKCASCACIKTFLNINLT